MGRADLPGLAAPLRIVASVTSPPLAVLAALMIISGYSMISPSITFKLFSINYSLGVLLHSTPFIRAGFAILAIIHGWSGLTYLAIVKLYFRCRALAHALTYLLTFAAAYALTSVIIAELE